MNSLLTWLRTPKGRADWHWLLNPGRFKRPRAVVSSALTSASSYLCIQVNEFNKREYVKLYVNYRWCRGIEQQFLALQKGFNELIPQQMLKPFDERELELVIGKFSQDISGPVLSGEVTSSFFMASSSTQVALARSTLSTGAHIPV